MVTNRRTILLIAFVACLALGLALAGPALGKGGPPPGKGHTETQGNNLSFPAIAVDGFSISSVTSAFTVAYAGLYPGLTDDEILALGADPWYAQKTEGNTWQADYVTQTAEAVTFVDWGDNIESNDPKLRRPFRLEVTLYKQLAVPMTAYTMAVLAYPSSSNELQGTNTTTYENGYATVISNSPRLVLQSLGQTLPDIPPEDWSGTQWGDYPIVPVSFAPELNVGGKYIFGASEGGWKPAAVGYYRITFYVPAGSGVDLSGAVVGNYADVSAGVSAEADEGGAATPVVVSEKNLTYVDVHVVGGGGGGKP